MRFKANPVNKGKVLRTGVWRSRAIPIIFRRRGAVVGVLSHRAGGWRLVDHFSPIIMTTLLMRVSGVTYAGEIFEGNETRLQRVRRNNQRVYSLVSAPQELKAEQKLTTAEHVVAHRSAIFACQQEAP